jgi:hypothetical protein
VQRLRALDLTKPPGVAEAISWAVALRVLGASGLTEDAAARTLGAVLKYPEDEQTARDAGLAALLTGPSS